MSKVILGVSAAAAIGLAPLGIPLAQPRSGDPCASITDPVAHQACIDKLREFWIRERRACEASPNHGQVGQVCG
jgi:hypothetical protein